MSYQSLDDYSDKRTFDDFLEAQSDAHRALKENDLYKVAIAIGNMSAQFELLWEHKKILARKCAPNS